MALTGGGKLGPYEIVGRIGAGGMGEVYRARDARLNREGSDLRGPLSFQEAVPVVRQLIDGIEAAHERNIIHRDLKPANLNRAITRDSQTVVNWTAELDRAASAGKK